MASIGQQLNSPEAGWKRYTFTNTFIKFTGNWSNNANYDMISPNRGDTVQFKFFGTKLRILVYSWSNRSDMSISIDGGAPITFHGYLGVNQTNTLAFEQTGLTNGMHTVVITNLGTNTYATFTAVDIDSNGVLMHLSEQTDVTKMKIGDRIRAEYTVLRQNTVGVLNNIGTSINDTFIPVSSSPTPQGAFFFIKVGTDILGRSILIADRNIQNNISWDTLNAVGIASGSGVPLQEISSIGLFNTVVYVDPVNGNDSNSGSSNSPVRTLNQAIQISNPGGAVILLPGVHTINTTYGYLHDLCTTKGLTFIGYGLQTVIEVQRCPTNYYQPAGTSAYFYNLVIRPSSSFAGDTRMIWYNTSGIEGNFALRFTNVLFTKSTNGSYPTTWWFAWTNSGTATPNVLFNNCSFATVPSAVEYGGTSTPLRYVNCAFGNSNTFASGAASGCAFSVSFNGSYHITSGGSDSSQGVYSGAFSWATFAINVASSGKYTIRLLTGGISSSDTNDEWDTYIVNSTLNGTITPGDNNVWNWQYQYSWASTVPSGYPGYRVIRGYSSAAFRNDGVNGSQSSAVNGNVGFRPVLVVVVPITTKYLIQDGSYVKYYSGGVWNTAGPTPVTQSYFDNYGMTDLTALTTATLFALSTTNPQLLINDQLSPSSKTVTITGAPTPRFLVPSADTSVIGPIQSMTLNVTVNGNGFVGVLISNDGGNTWYTYKSSSWVAVDTTNMANIDANAMSPSVLSSIPASAWAQIAPNNQFRIGYYLKLTSSSDVANVNSLTISYLVNNLTPTVNSITVNYVAIDPNYTGLMFMTADGSAYYSDNKGNVITLLDFGNVVAGQTTQPVAVQMRNTNPFSVNNVILTATNPDPLVQVQLSRSNNPFIPESPLVFPNTLAPDQYDMFWVRLVTDKNAKNGGTFIINVKASPC